MAGGETAEMPGIYHKDKFDLAGFSVGLVDKEKILDGRKISTEDLLIAIPSSGLHSNGFSLVRYILKKKKIYNKNLLKEFLTPTKIYVNEVLKLHTRGLINGCCNITGGGIIENLPRILPKNKAVEINLDKIKTLKIFKFLKNFSNWIFGTCFVKCFFHYNRISRCNICYFYVSVNLFSTNIGAIEK